MRVGNTEATARLAEVGAQAVVAVATTDGYAWLLGRIRETLGESSAILLEQSRTRLVAVTGSAAVQAEELATWRWQLRDAVSHRPELAIGLRGLIDEASVRLIVAAPATPNRPTRDPALVPAGQATAAGPASVPPLPVRWGLARRTVLATLLLLVVVVGAFTIWHDLTP